MDQYEQHRHHTQQATSHLEAAKATRLRLVEAYAATRPDRAEIADLHQTINFGLKVAEVHALLALSSLPTTPGSGSARFTTTTRAEEIPL